MIKHTEIRIGNIVKMPSSEQLTVITAMDISDIQSNLKNRLPVELNEEMLLKVGYEIANRKHTFISFDSSPYVYLLENGCVSMSTGIEMKYLHELQNRVFSLTGHEINTSNLL